MKKKLSKYLSVLLVISLIFCSSCAKAENKEPVSSQEITFVTEISTEAPTPESKEENEEEVTEPEHIKTEEELRLDKAFAAIDAVVSSDVDAGFSSAQLAVWWDGRIIYQNAWGLVNSYDNEGNRLPYGKDADNDTLYDLASNTKMYSVVYAFELLVSRNKADLDTRIVDILGDAFAEDVIDISYLKGAKVSLETQKEWKRRITIRDLLCHRAGFPDSIHYYDPEFSVEALKHIDGAENKLYQGENYLRDNAFSLFAKTPLYCEPGGEPYYSDIDYMVLALVLEQITGMSLDEYLEKNFYEPMGLENITFTPLENGFSADNIAATELHGNTRDGAVSFPGIRDYLLQGEVHDECAYYTMGGISGHAGLFASATDLAKLCSVMLDGTFEGVEYFSKAVIDDFTAAIPGYDGWGTGWWRHSENGAREYYFSEYSSYNTVGHQGWTGTLTMIDREKGLVLVLLTNKINSPVTDIAADSNMFDAKWYTTGNLGFAASMIYAALTSEDEESLQAGIIGEFDRYAEKSLKQLNSVKNPSDTHPAKLAYTAIINAKENWENNN